MKQSHTLILFVAFALALAHVCQAGFPFGGEPASCSAASVSGVEQCPGTEGEAVQIRNIGFVPSVLSVGGDVTVSGDISIDKSLDSLFLQVYIENSPMMGPFNQFSIDVCSQAEMSGEEICPMPATNGFMHFSELVTIPGPPIFMPGHYCGNVTALSSDGGALGCALFNVQLS
mmetsp:Transcript_2461/g.8781  ORF Transcript_2461/g.8781 Transcript_2461/m.8781 type:complete len:173 (-) Transcript_2461:518-1036(-)